MKTIPVVIEFDPETGTFGATSPDLADVFAVGASRDEVLERFKNAADDYLSYLREQNQPLPALDSTAEVVTITIAAA